MLLLLSIGACGFTVTSERPTFEQLEQHEKSVVETVLAELKGFNTQVERRTNLDIKAVLDRERINVSFEGNIFFANLGDGIVHVAPWENLSDKQQLLVRTWFKKSTSAGARDLYRSLFYKFLAVSQGAKQFMYEALTPEWVYANRSLYNVERDTIRNTLSYYKTVGQKTAIWNLTRSACTPILAQYEKKYGSTFSKKYLIQNLQTLADPKAPTGYMYYVCRWIEMGKVDFVDLSTELAWVEDLQKRANSQ